jgi:hypothetical protein
MKSRESKEGRRVGRKEKTRGKPSSAVHVKDKASTVKLKAVKEEGSK